MKQPGIEIRKIERIKKTSKENGEKNGKIRKKGGNMKYWNKRMARKKKDKKRWNKGKIVKKKA